MSLLRREINFQEVWTRIRHTIGKLITLGHVDPEEFRDRFNDVYAVCNALPVELHKELYIATEQYLVQHIKELCETAASSNEQLLVFYYEGWNAYTKGINYLTHLYKYLNDKRLVDNEGNIMMPSWKLGLAIWKRHMIEPLKSKLLHLLLDGIRLDRRGVSPNQSLLYGVIETFVKVEEYETDNLEFYRKIFETPFLEDTGEYYKQEASRLVQDNDRSQYMKKALHKLEEEDFRSRKYLHPISYTKVTRECVLRMISYQLEFLLGELKNMVDENKKDLGHVYRLLKLFPVATDVLRQVFKQHITKIGIETIAAVKGDSIPQTFVECFIALYDEFSSLIESVFSGDHHFVSALDKACDSIVNHDWNPNFKCQAPELLAKYCDSFLKKNAKLCSEDEVENKLNHTMAIFKHIDDKDIFQKFYARFLAKRLIHKQSMSMDAEESMIKKLKGTSWYEYTNKLHYMFTDVSISDDLNRSFTELKKRQNIKLGISFSISVLQTSAWPFVQTNSKFSIPQELEKNIKTFESFYSKKFSGRKLTWLHHMFDAELKLCYLKKPYVVSMSTYQMAILLLFERTDVLTYGEISENTKLSDEQLPKQIKSLLESKLILATDSEESFRAQSSFCLNKKYTNKKTNFKLAPASQKETAKQEAIKTHASVAFERKEFIKAAIVRIMKARKVLWYNTIIQEVINQSKNRFVPNLSLIRKCIEELIDQVYIERTSNSADEYRYVEQSEQI